MENGTANRVRLWLRSERAFGLTSVVLPRKTQLDRVGGIATPRHVEASPAPEVQRRADERTISRQAQNVPPPELYQGVSKPTEYAPQGGLIPPPADETFSAPLLATDEKKK